MTNYCECCGQEIEPPEEMNVMMWYPYNEHNIITLRMILTPGVIPNADFGLLINLKYKLPKMVLLVNDPNIVQQMQNCMNEIDIELHRRYS